MNTAPARAPIAATERMPPTRATVWLSPAATPASSSGAGDSAAAVIGATTAGSPSAKRTDARNPPRPGVGARSDGQEQEQLATPIVAAPAAIGKRGPLRSA